MAKYKISLESEIRLFVKCITVKTEYATSTELVEGDMKDVAKVMFNHEVNCIKLNNIEKLTDNVYTICSFKDSLNHILEMGYCVTQVCNKLGEDVCSILTLTQISERIG
jgi:hypothetical protein